MRPLSGVRIAALRRGAQTVVIGKGLRYRDADPNCGLFPNDPLLSPGADAAGG